MSGWGLWSSMRCMQAFAINPMRLLFPYFGVIMNLLQCCGLCSTLSYLFPCACAHPVGKKAACDSCRISSMCSCMGATGVLLLHSCMSSGE